MTLLSLKPGYCLFFLRSLGFCLARQLEIKLLNRGGVASSTLRLYWNAGILRLCNNGIINIPKPVMFHKKISKQINVQSVSVNLDSKLTNKTSVVYHIYPLLAFFTAKLISLLMALSFGNFLQLSRHDFGARFWSNFQNSWQFHIAVNILSVILCLCVQNDHFVGK